MTQYKELLTEQEIREKIEVYKMKQREDYERARAYNLPYTRIFSSDERTIEIYKIICSKQEIFPHNPITRGDIEPETSLNYQAVKRALSLLREIKAIGYDDKKHQYWIPKYQKKHEEYLLEQKRQTAVYAKKLKKSLALAKKHNKELKKGTLDLETAVEIAEPYLDNLRYCESDEDWELLIKWFMKMQENKHYQKEAEAQEETEKSNAEITKEHPIPEKAEIPKNVKITEPEKLKPIEKTPWDE